MQYIINSLYPFVDLTHMYIIFEALGETANAKAFFWEFTTQSVRMVSLLGFTEM